MATLNPYVNFPGNTEQAFQFYRSVFGGEFTAVMRLKDIPSEFQDPNVDGNLIMHIALPIGDGAVLMGTDAVESPMRPPFQAGNNFSLSFSADSMEHADRIHAGLSAGGQVIMPMADAFWGQYFGMCVDKFGMVWMIGFQANEPQ